jgi:hypothetical protein
MTAWITSEIVGVLVRTDLSADTFIDDLIDHVQGLSENEIGEQADPSNGLKAVFAEIVARKWRAGRAAEMNPAGFQSDSAGPYSMSDPGARAGVGLGLTDREKQDLRRAVGLGGMWLQPTSRSDRLETSGRFWGPDIDPDSLVSVEGGAPAPWFPPEDP